MKSPKAKFRAADRCGTVSGSGLLVGAKATRPLGRFLPMNWQPSFAARLRRKLLVSDSNLTCEEPRVRKNCELPLEHAMEKDALKFWFG
jgi:hypothetical protein